jgi:hypothetical protein
MIGTVDADSATADSQLNIGGWITGLAGAITIPGSLNGMKIQTATGTVADVTSMTQIAQFTVVDGTTWKLNIGSYNAANTEGSHEYSGNTGGAGRTVPASFTFRSHAWEAYYEVVTTTAGTTVTVNAYRGSDANRLSSFEIILLTALN